MKHTSLPSRWRSLVQTWAWLLLAGDDTGIGARVFHSAGQPLSG